MRGRGHVSQQSQQTCHCWNYKLQVLPSPALKTTSSSGAVFAETNGPFPPTVPAHTAYANLPQASGNVPFKLISSNHGHASLREEGGFFNGHSQFDPSYIAFPLQGRAYFSLNNRKPHGKTLAQKVVLAKIVMVFLGGEGNCHWPPTTCKPQAGLGRAFPQTAVPTVQRHFSLRGFVPSHTLPGRSPDW